MENFFVSPVFAIATIAIFIIYYLPYPDRARLSIQLCLIAAASFFMYWLAAGNLLFLLLFSAIANATLSYLITYGESGRRRMFLIVGVVINLSLLVFFKYKKLFIPEPIFDGWFGADSTWKTIYQLALPVGISFYVFHGISLLIDSYRRSIPLMEDGSGFFRHFWKTLLYISFFPQVVAGPIAKGKFFFPQIRLKKFTEIPWDEALWALAQGYFLKEVVANNLNQLTERMIRPDLWSHTPPSELATMILAYSAQIFSDFAGYSLIAIGFGRLLGYELPINFAQPYFADSFSNFWKRWHISLSSWLRDYLYIPLGGNRKGRIVTYINMMLVMFLGGLWHGPAWKYASWGVAHGLGLSIERVAKNSALGRVVPTNFVFKFGRIIVVFVCVSLFWLFFRLSSLSQVFTYVSLIFSSVAAQNTFSGIRISMMLTLCGIVLIQHIFGELSDRGRLAWLAPYQGYIAGILLALAIIAKGEESAFIYFQF